MRALPFGEEFDAIVCFFTAFGYFDDAGCRQTLAEFRRVLRSGGRALVDINNVWAIMRGFAPEEVWERDGSLLIDRRHIDPPTSRLVSERITVRDGVTSRAHYFIRLFAFPELRDWLLTAGFDAAEAYSESGPLTQDSRRLMVVASRNGR